ncbi:SIMPL domain-containing protein [Halomarina pelagica]|uniref:SIMPL domain-containing protein n=1 Tax=Halomarina pelagica TaxID=2961599 RepID=UPI0020C2FB2B|nr:SIMPL domain-containing protein [Halomarina sp. BND7]
MPSRTTRTNVTLAGALALLLVTAGCLSTATPGAGAPSIENGRNAVSVTGTGTVEAAPDRAELHLAVVATAESADAARERAAEDAARLREALRAAGVPDDAVETVGYSLGAEYDYGEKRREVVGYRAVHTYRVTLSDVDAAGSVVDAAVENGAARVSSVRFTLSEERREKLRARAIERAMDRARSDAEAVAAAGDLTLGGIESASTVDHGLPRPVYAEAAVAAGSDGGAKTRFDPGRVAVTATVTVDYAIE